MIAQEAAPVKMRAADRAAARKKKRPGHRPGSPSNARRYEGFEASPSNARRYEGFEASPSNARRYGGFEASPSKQSLERRTLPARRDARRCGVSASSSVSPVGADALGGPPIRAGAAGCEGFAERCSALLFTVHCSLFTVHSLRGVVVEIALDEDDGGALVAGAEPRRQSRDCGLDACRDQKRK